MAEDFKDILFSSEFIHAQSVIEEGKDTEIKGKLFIENEKDRLFWEALLGEEITSLYEFSMANGPSSVDDGDRGKRRFYSNFKYANQHSIFAIDSDFAHFAPDRENFHKQVIENDYIIHTYAYSKESLCNCIDNLDSAISKYRYFEKHEYSFHTFLTQYSNKIYKPLLCYLFLFSQKKEPLNEASFAKLLTPDINTFFNEEWDNFEDRMGKFIAAHDQAKNPDFEEFVESTKVFGLECNNTYQFINGHTLEKSIIAPIVSKIRQNISEKVITELKLCNPAGNVISDKVKELKNHFKEECCFQTLKMQSKAYLNTDLYNKMSKQFTVLTN